MDTSSTEKLRQELNSVIFRGRTRPKISDNSIQSADISFDSAKSAISCQFPKSEPVSLSVVNHTKDTVTWEKVTIDLHDDSDPSQSTLNLLIAKPKSAPPEQKLAVICILHPTSGQCDSEEMLQHVLRFTGLGFLVVGLNSRYHGCRRGEGYSGKERYLKALTQAWKQNKSDDVRKNIYPFIYDTVADLSSVADYLLSRFDVCPKRMGLTGISLGGMHAWFAGAADPRWTAIAPLIGVQSFQYAVDKNCFHARVDSIRDVFEVAAADLGYEDINSEVVREVWNKICPGLVDSFDACNSLALLSPRPVLIGNGELDPRCHIEGVKVALEHAKTLAKAWNTNTTDWNIELKVYKNVGHQVTEEMFDDCVNFFLHVFHVDDYSKYDYKFDIGVPSTEIMDGNVM